VRNRCRWWLLRFTLRSVDHFRDASNSCSAASTAARAVARAVASFAIISRCHERTVVQIWCTMQ